MIPVAAINCLPMINDDSSLFLYLQKSKQLELAMEKEPHGKSQAMDQLPLLFAKWTAKRFEDSLIYQWPSIVFVS